MAIGIEELVEQQAITNRLIAAFVSAMYPERLPQHRLVAILAETGASDEAIALALGTTAGTVATTRSRQKKGASRGEEETVGQEETG